jgi:hypothetical protein
MSSINVKPERLQRLNLVIDLTSSRRPEPFENPEWRNSI